MAATIKDLGKVTAYAYAKAAGYTGTEAEFQQVFDEFTQNAPGLITRMDTAVARAEAAVTEIDATVQDAVDEAVDEATASAVATANQAVTDAQAAQTAAEGAVTQANAAVTQANNAVTAAQAAQSAAEDAAASFVLDRTLTDSGAAAPADLVGNLKESMHDLESDNGVAPNMINSSETWQAKIDDYNTTIEGTVYQVSSNTVTTLTGSDVSTQFGVLIRIDDMPDVLAIYDDVTQGYSTKLILSSGTELNSNVLVYYTKTNFANQSSNFASFCTKYADYYILNKAAMLALYPSVQSIFVNVVASLFDAKEVLSISGKPLNWIRLVAKNFDADNIVKPNAIDGTGHSTTEITEAITTNSYWYATGSATIASGGTMAGMDKAVFDISNMTGKIVFGYDSEVSYGSGSFVLGLSSATEAPYTRITYFNKSDVENNASGYFSLGDNYAIVDLGALKAAYPTGKLLFVNIPHSVWLLENRIDIRKALKWLLVTGCVPALVVSQDGTGDYTTISDAVFAAKNGDTIYIKDGEYKETVIVNKYIHLVGQSKQNTILYNDIGDYNNAPLLITQGSVCNMTIKSLAPADTSGLTDYAYGIHLDKNFASLAKYQKCEIYNCDIYSEVNDAIGAGTNYASEYDIHDCFLHVVHNPVKTGACGFKCHNGNNQTTGKVTLRNNVIITEDADGTTCYDILYHNGGISNTQPIEILQIGNALKYYYNGITNIFAPSAYNYGNSVAEMNTLS